MTSDLTIQEELKRYKTMFFILVFLTIVIVGIHYLSEILHLNRMLKTVCILTVAFVQAGLSACYLMHLISERKLIYLVLILTIMTFVGFGLIHYHYYSVPQGTVYVS